MIQLIPPVLSSETLLHILLSSEYSGFRPSTTAVVTISAPVSVSTGPKFRRYSAPGGGGHSLVSSVPMRDQKNDEKGYFFSRRAVRSADII